MKAGDLVRIKPSIVDMQPNRVLLVQRVFEHKEQLWVRTYGAKHSWEADHFEVVSEVVSESR